MDYLNTSKSIMISSPAGSGKTEKLARRYIALLQGGAEVERILAITFTDKAAAEMKQRILKTLRKEDEERFRHILSRMPLMRVSTIHAFCGNLLRRFSFETGIQPNYTIQDSVDSRMMWDEIMYEVLMEAGKGSEGHALLVQTLSEKGFRGLDYMKGTIDHLYQRMPFSLGAEPWCHIPLVTGTAISELKSWPGISEVIENYETIIEKGSSEELRSLEKYFLTEAKAPRKRAPQSLKGIPAFQDWASGMYEYWKDRRLLFYAERTARVRKILESCLDRYSEKKRMAGALDFSDLEYLAYKMLTEDPEWMNILYAFDERTDHILVDEFQDTNAFQWTVINKLTEEWRSGLGAKRDEGTRPTIFFVGDEKQSIYFFRGANVEIFHRAKEQMQAWLGREFIYGEAKENYRSLPVIVDFTNQLFSRTMKPLREELPWASRYSPFTAQRPGIPYEGRVEIILADDEEGATEEMKQREADIIAKRIRSLAGRFHITDRDTQLQKLCSYMDMAILLRKRTHISKYEEALRRHGVPFVAVKGVGFYQEPEIAVLRSLVYFLSNPHDDYSLYILLKSPLFNITEGMIIRLLDLEGRSLYDKMRNAAEDFRIATGILQDLRAKVSHIPVAEAIEHALVITKAWRYFYEPQRRSNIKKFIRIIEDLESGGKTLLKIRDFLERTCSKEEEPKANVNTEGMDAVRIMTIHAAKGLEFPIVFVPGIEERFKSGAGEDLVYEKEGRFFYKTLPEPVIRKQDEDFLVQQAKEEEEQKRLFYVAVTRAEEALVLTGAWNDGGMSFLGFLRQAIGLEKQGDTFIASSDIRGLSLLTEGDVNMLHEHANIPVPEKKVTTHVAAVPLPEGPRTDWKSVTEDADIRSRHGDDWLVTGDIMHRIFEWISKSVLNEQDIRQKAGELLRRKNVPESLREEKIAVIERDIRLLQGKDIWQEIIAPREDSFTELPFILDTGETVYTGRIDRVIIRNGVYNIYDYKTFPVKEEETGYLLKEYSFQMHLYKRAVMSLFDTKEVKSFIVFTHIGEVREIV